MRPRIFLARATLTRGSGLMIVGLLLAGGMAFSECAAADGKPRADASVVSGTACPLTWASQRVELRPGVEAYRSSAGLEARFAFTNAGNSPWEIVSVEPDCGCTAAMATVPTAEPGKSGEVLARFTAAERTGRQEKRILVRAREAAREGPGEIVARLTLVVHLPDLVRITPAKLSWTLGEKAEPKTLLVEAASGEMPLERVTARSTQVLFRTEVRAVEAGRRYEVTVQPTGTEVLITGHLPISCQFVQPPSAAEGREKPSSASAAAASENPSRLYVVVADIVPRLENAAAAAATTTTTTAVGTMGR